MPRSTLFMLLFSALAIANEKDTAKAVKPTKKQSKATVRPIDLRILKLKKFKRPLAKHVYPPSLNSMRRIRTEADARNWLTDDSIAKLRLVLNFAKEDLVMLTCFSELHLSHQLYKTKNGTTVMFFASRLVSFSFAHRTTRFYAVPHDATLRLFPRPDWQRGLSARLILNKKKYVLPNGLPKVSKKIDPYLIDFDIEIENTSKKPIRINVGGDACHLMLTLNGPGAVNNVRLEKSTAKLGGLNQLVYRPGVSLTIPAGKKRRLSLRDLLQAKGLKHCWAYWTKPGKYTLHLYLMFIRGPELTKTARLVNMHPRLESFDFPVVSLTVRPAVEEKK